MQHAFGNDKSLSGREVDRSTFQINQQPTFDNIEKFVVISVLVPMILALDHPDADDRRIDLAKRLIEPRFTRIGNLFLVNDLQCTVQNIKPRIVGEILDVAHAGITITAFGVNAIVRCENWAATSFTRPP